MAFREAGSVDLPYVVLDRVALSFLKFWDAPGLTIPVQGAGDNCG